MKKIFILFSALLFAANTHAGATTDTTGLPGDHFDLYAMLDLFRSSANPEEFERKLNTEANHVNNLDLNGDGKTDYVRVIDYTKENAHAIVLQVPVNEKESQDIAVIEIEMKGENSAQLQVIGDELLYGKDYIIEPVSTQDSTLNENKYTGEQTFVFVNVWYWPCVTYMYYPGYVVWVSPWYWMYWPSWWYPWTPVTWVVYYEWVSPCHHHYHHAPEPRMNTAHDVYQPRRVYSPQVNAQTAGVRKRIEQKNSEAGPRTPAKPGTPAPPQQKPGGEPRKPTGQPSPSPSPSPRPAPAPSPRPAPGPSPKPAPKVTPQPAPAPRPRPKQDNVQANVSDTLGS